MKNIYTRFLAVVVIIVMTFGCTLVAHADEGNPYQEYLDAVPSSGIIIPAETAIMLEPSAESEQIGTLKSGTACLVRGKYSNIAEFTDYCIIDLTGININGHETGYGFINRFDVLLNPQWLMFAYPVIMDSTPWETNRWNGMVSGLVMAIDKNDEYYAIHTLDNVSGTSFIPEYYVSEYSQSNQDLWVVPLSTPVYDDSKKEQVGEIPGFTIVDVKEKNNDFIYVTVNPGTSDEFSGWIPWQPILELLN